MLKGDVAAGNVCSKGDVAAGNVGDDTLPVQQQGGSTLWGGTLWGGTLWGGTLWSQGWDSSQIGKAMLPVLLNCDIVLSTTQTSIYDLLLLDMLPCQQVQPQCMHFVRVHTLRYETLTCCICFGKDLSMFKHRLMQKTHGNCILCFLH